jgi:hypothetical protein
MPEEAKGSPITVGRQPLRLSTSVAPSSVERPTRYDRYSMASRPALVSEQGTWPQPAECHIDSGTGKVRAETRETATLRGLVVAGGYRAGAGGLLQETLQRAEGR